MSAQACNEDARLDTVKQILDVVDGKAICPECQRKVRVNRRRKEFYSHNRKNSVEVCPVRGDFKFNVIWSPPKKIPRAAIEGEIVRMRIQNSKEKKRKMKNRVEFTHIQEDPYPENWGNSFRSAGFTQ